MRHIKFAPDMPCMLCGQKAMIQERYWISNDGEDFVCEVCEDAHNKNKASNNRESFNCFVGSVDVQQVVMNLIAELQDKLTKLGGDLISLDANRELFGGVIDLKKIMVNKEIDAVSKQIFNLRKRLFMLMPEITNQPKEDDFELLKEKAKEHSIKDILNEYGLKHEFLNSTGYKFKCPFHNENDASFMVYKKTNTSFCFGCGFHGDSIGVYMKLHNKTFVESVKELSCG